MSQGTFNSLQIQFSLQISKKCRQIMTPSNKKHEESINLLESGDTRNLEITQFEYLILWVSGTKVCYTRWPSRKGQRTFKGQITLKSTLSLLGGSISVTGGSTQARLCPLREGQCFLHIFVPYTNHSSPKKK